MCHFIDSQHALTIVVSWRLGEFYVTPPRQKLVTAAGYRSVVNDTVHLPDVLIRASDESLSYATLLPFRIVFSSEASLKYECSPAAPLDFDASTSFPVARAPPRLLQHNARCIFYVESVLDA